MIFAELLTMGVMIDNCLVNSSTWTTTTTQKWIVPAGKRWWVYGGCTYRDTATGTATLDIKAMNSTDQKMFVMLDTDADNATVRPWPSNKDLAAHAQYPFPLDAGDYILVTIGEAQGATAYLSCVVIEVDM